MATHSSILAWRIPWTEEPGGLQSKFDVVAFVFSSLSLVCGRHSKEPLLRLSKNMLSLFSSRSFCVPGLTFKS